MSGIENKVILLGEPGVGKTTLIRVSIGEKFEEIYTPSISLSFFSKTVTFNNKNYMFNLWDTIGQEKFRAFTKIFYKNSKVIIFVYNITDKKSFKNLEYWLDSVNTELGNEKYIKAIVGNKSDLFLNEQVKEEEARKYAISKGAKFKLCSAKKNPLDFIKFLDELCIDSIKEKDKNIDETNNSVILNKKEMKKDKKNCNC